MDHVRRGWAGSHLRPHHLLDLQLDQGDLWDAVSTGTGKPDRKDKCVGSWQHFWKQNQLMKKRAQRARRKPRKKQLRISHRGSVEVLLVVIPLLFRHRSPTAHKCGWALSQAASFTVHLNLVLDLQGWSYLKSTSKSVSALETCPSSEREIQV